MLPVLLPKFFNNDIEMSAMMRSNSCVHSLQRRGGSHALYGCRDRHAVTIPRHPL